MKRPIDAYTCMEQIKNMSVEYDAKTVQRCIEIVSNAPTIDAVPISFIRSEIERMKEGNNRYYSECEAYAEDLDILLMEWERRKNERDY